MLVLCILFTTIVSLGELPAEDKLNPEIKSYLKTLDFVENIYIIGGLNAVSEKVKKA